MLVVQKGNKQLNIDEIQKDIYLSLGYSVVNEKGEVEEAGQATTLADLQAENTTLKEKLTEYKEIKVENEKLKAENETFKVGYEALQNENASLKEQLEAATKKTK